MVEKIVWTTGAETDVKGIVEYLEREWGRYAAERFIAHLFGQLEKLASMPTLARTTTKLNVFFYQLDKKNVIFFKLKEEVLIVLSIYPYKRTTKPVVFFD